MMGHGVSSRSSHSCAAGRMTFSENPCTQSRMSFWSCVSASENVGSEGAAACSAGVSAVVAMRRSYPLVGSVAPGGWTPMSERRLAGPRGVRQEREVLAEAGQPERVQHVAARAADLEAASGARRVLRRADQRAETRRVEEGDAGDVDHHIEPLRAQAGDAGADLGPRDEIDLAPEREVHAHAYVRPPRPAKNAMIARIASAKRIGWMITPPAI